MEGVDDWYVCDDPAELRIRLDVVLEENAELYTHLAALRAENAALRKRLGMSTSDGQAALPPVPEAPAALPRSDGSLPYADASSSTEAKIALFRAVFVGREDVYATRWVSAKSGRTGWSPAEDNPFAKNKNHAEQVFWPLSDKAVFNHLPGPIRGAGRYTSGFIRCWPTTPAACSLSTSTARTAATGAAMPQPAGTPRYRSSRRSRGPGPARTCGSSSPPRWPRPLPAHSAWRCCAAPSTPAAR